MWHRRLNISSSIMTDANKRFPRIHNLRSYHKEMEEEIVCYQWKDHFFVTFRILSPSLTACQGCQERENPNNEILDRRLHHMSLVTAYD